MTSTTTATQGRRPARGVQTFRPDVEGLRAVAVGAVLLYHAGVPWVGGGFVGVDVFFVISGYLITGLLLRELEGRGTLSLRTFYARRARRLLPSLALVLVTVSVLAWLVLPPVRRATVYGDVVAAALYVVNWWFVHTTVDYSAAGMQASPVQHIWSLAVEEQFYLAWPLLMLGVAAWPRGRGSLRSRLLVVVGAVTAASFGYCVLLTATEAGRAYFSTFTRGWELGVGALLAVALARSEPGRVPARGLLALLGLGAIAAAVVGFDDATLFPGAWALLPSLGAAAVVLAGSGGGAPTGPQRLLASAPMRHVGRLSYTWYLWHWPLLVFAEARWGRLGPVAGLLVVAASYLPTLATHRLVEERFRRSARLARRPALALGVGLVCTGLVTVVGVGLSAATPVVPTASAKEAPGAKAPGVRSSLQTRADRVRPAPQDAAQDRGRVYDAGCLVHREDTSSPRCVFGAEDSPRTAVLFGDSHAMQWFPALVRVVRRSDWRLVVLTKAACPPSDAPIFNPKLKRRFTECDRWRGAALHRVERIHPDLVVTGSATDYGVVDHDGGELGGAESRARLRSGYHGVLRRLRDASARVIALQDIPHHRAQVPDCVAGHLRHLDACAIPEDVAVTFTPLADAAHRTAGVGVVDPTPELCPHGTCPGVMGNVLMYRDAGHLTATYVRSLDDWLAAQLELPRPRPAASAATG